MPMHRFLSLKFTKLACYGDIFMVCKAFHRKYRMALQQRCRCNMNEHTIHINSCACARARVQLSKKIRNEEKEINATQLTRIYALCTVELQHQLWLSILLWLFFLLYRVLLLLLLPVPLIVIVLFPSRRLFSFVASLFSEFLHSMCLLSFDTS